MACYLPAIGPAIGPADRAIRRVICCSYACVEGSLVAYLVEFLRHRQKDTQMRLIIVHMSRDAAVLGGYQAPNRLPDRI